MEKILVIHTNGMGDFIMFTPALKLLRKKYPEAKLDVLLTNKNIKKFIEEQKLFDNIYFSDLTILSLLKSVFLLRKKYDLSFFTVGGKIWKAKFFNFLLKSKITIGEVEKMNKKYPYNKVIIRDNNVHFVDANLKLIQLITENQNNIDVKLEIQINLESKEKANKFIKSNKLENKIIFGVHPGCQKAYAARRWPEKYFAEVINKIQKNEKIKCIVFLGPEDEEVGKYLKKNTNALFIENENLNNVIALISKCEYFFNSDSGLGHIFTCFNKKIFSIFGPNQLGLNQELRTGPYSEERVILKIENMSQEYYLKINENGVYECLIDLKPKFVIEQILKKMKFN